MTKQKNWNKYSQVKVEFLKIGNLKDAIKWNEWIISFSKKLVEKS